MSATPPNDGGPAYPVGDSEGSPFVAHPGMSLRDWFAGQALAGLLADPNVTVAEALVAAMAYRYADAMLAERAKESAK